MTKLEEVARAIEVARDLGPAAQARAAIQALREPNSEMLDAVQTEVDICDESKERPSSNYVEFISRDEARSTWQAGVDAILSEGE